MIYVQTAVIVLVVLAAVAYMARRTIRKYKGVGGGCGKAKPKNVSLTIGGQSVRRH